MNEFAEHLSNFVAEVSNLSLMEIMSNERYTAYKKTEQELLERLKQLINKEEHGILLELQQAYTNAHSMMICAAVICGLTISSEVRKHFDTSTPEYAALVKEHI